MEWIKCSERLPEYGQKVIICFKGVITGDQLLKIDNLIRYHNNDPEWQYTSGPNNVTHWMHLPELPKIESL